MRKFQSFFDQKRHFSGLKRKLLLDSTAENAIQEKHTTQLNTEIRKYESMQNTHIVNTMTKIRQVNNSNKILFLNL